MSDLHVETREAEHRRASTRPFDVDRPSHAAPPLPAPALHSLVADPLFRDRGNRPVRAQVMQHLQETHGNHNVQRYLQTSRTDVYAQAAEEGDFTPLIEARAGSARGLDDVTRRLLEHGLGADLSGVRVHTDEEADRLALSIDALAFTSANDIFFRSGTYNPRTSEGLRLLAHEATHVAQQQKAGMRPAVATHLSISRTSDDAEREAEAAADQTLAGKQVDVRAKPNASISRLALSDMTRAMTVAPALLGPMGMPLSLAGASLHAAGLYQNQMASNPHGGFIDTVSGMFDQEQSQRREMAGAVQTGEHAFGQGLEWVENRMMTPTRAIAAQAQNVPVLGTLANLGVGAADVFAQYNIGFAKGAGSLVSGLAQAAVNPVDTAVGLWSVAEQAPMGPVNPYRLAHGAYDVLANDRPVDKVANEVFNPAEQGKSLYNIGAHLLEPYTEAWDRERYGEVAGRAVFDIGSFLVGGGEARAGVEGTALADDAARMTRLIEEAPHVAPMARATEGVGAVSDAARVNRAVEGGIIANEAPRTSVLAQGGEQLSPLAHHGQGADVAAHGAASGSGTVAVPRRGELGHVTAYNRQPPAVYDSAGARMTENEHIIPRGNTEAMTRNPQTGLPDYTDTHYRHDATVRTSHDMALNKTHGNRGGLGADNPRTAAIKRRAASGQPVDYRRDIFGPSIENAKRARDATRSLEITDEAIHRGALEQDANLFAMQTPQQSGEIVKNLGLGSTVDAAWDLIEDFKDLFLVR